MTFHAGASPLRQVDCRFGLIDTINACLSTPRKPEPSQHDHYSCWLGYLQHRLAPIDSITSTSAR
jgi:hypothetical protein